MKKLITLFLICALGVIACGKKIMPESDANNQSKPVSEKVEKSPGQNSNTNSPSNSEPSFNNMKGTQPAIPDGSKSVDLTPGKTVFVSKCAGCHTLKNPGDYTVDQTYSFLKVEIPKAKLTRREADDLTAYMIANAKK